MPMHGSPACGEAHVRFVTFTNGNVAVGAGEFDSIGASPATLAACNPFIKGHDTC